MHKGVRTVAIAYLALPGFFWLASNGGCVQSSSDTQTDTGQAETELSLTITGRGQVTLAPSGTTYDAEDTPATSVYDKDETVSLTASADAGWVLCYWTNDLTGSGAFATLTMNADKQVTAVFLPADVCTMLGAVAPPGEDEDEPYEAGTWTGYIAAEHIVTSEDSGQCASSDGDARHQYEFEENESRRAAVTIGPVMDMAWQQAAVGEFKAVMANSYHTVTTYNTRDCCRDEPDCRIVDVVAPGNIFDNLTTDEAEEAFSITVDIPALKVEVVLTVLPTTADEDDPLAGALGMAEWIWPYENQTIPVRIGVSINPTQEVEFTECTLDKLTDACSATTSTTSECDSAGTFNSDMDFEFEGTLIKRGSGQHEIVGFFIADWTEQGRSTPCDSYAERSATENCTVHLIRRP